MITRRLLNALEKLADMHHPSVANLLKKNGFGYEGNQVKELVEAFEEFKSEVGEPEVMEDEIGKEKQTTDPRTPDEVLAIDVAKAFDLFNEWHADEVSEESEVQEKSLRLIDRLRNDAQP